MNVRYHYKFLVFLCYTISGDLMKYMIDNHEYEVKITRKSNKNTYIRFKDGILNVTTSYFVTNKQIIKILDENKVSLADIINKVSKKKTYSDTNMIFGEKYDIIIVNNIETIDFKNKKIYTSSKDNANKLLVKYALEIFEKRLDHNYSLFSEKIPYPMLRVRKMKTRWGVCNRKENKVTLNLELIKYGIEEIDYVIIHELAHFIHFDHSKSFWTLVSKYCENYKIIRKKLKEN